MTARLMCLVVALVLASAVATAQQVTPADFVRNMYLQYAGVDPDRGIIDVWVKELNKGTPAVEVHAQILGSNQTFDAVGKNNDTWIRLMYNKVLSREPDVGGMRTWQQKLEALKYDRVKTAREFLRGAGAELNAGGGGGARPGNPPPADLPTHLTATAQLLAQAATTEFPGYEHLGVRSQGGSFVKSVAAYMPILKEPNRYPREYPEGIRALTATLDVFEHSVAQSRVAAPNTRLYAEQCRQLLASLSPGGRPIDPGLPPGGGAGRLTPQEGREYRRLLDVLSKDLTAAETTFRIVIPKGWATTRLLNRVDDLMTDVDNLRDDVRGGFDRRELLRRVQAINATAGDITNTLTAERVDVRATQAWYSVATSLAAVTDPQNAGPPGQPGGGRVPRELFEAIDQASAQCDALLLAYSPYATYNRSVGRLTADLTDLKTRYAALRRTAGGLDPSRRELDTHLNGIAGRMKTVSGHWRDVAGDRNLASVADLTELAVADRDVTRRISPVR